MKVLSFHMGSDTGGVSIANKRAFDRHAPAGWQFRSMVSTLNYIRYPTDIRWSIAGVQEWWEWADVIHLHHNFASADWVERGFKRLPRLARKPYVIEFHGVSDFDGGLNRFRSVSAARMACRQRKALPVVSTLNTHLLAPDVFEWVPVPQAVDDLQQMRTEFYREGRRLRIGHAPTNRALKNTDEVIQAVKDLQAAGQPVELVLIEGSTWEKCLHRKATCDLFVDQVGLAYGCNALEAGGMGIPTIAGGQWPTIEEAVRRFGRWPFALAHAGRIREEMAVLVGSAAYRQEVGERGLDYIRLVHNERAVVEQLVGIYERAA